MMCYTVSMNAKTTIAKRATTPDTDADIDRFLAEHHDELAAKLAAGREQVARGEAGPLEALDVLLREARAGR
jgi:hypothetical protein